MNRLRCLFRGHPGWKETFLMRQSEGSFGLQLATKGGPISGEAEAYILGGRSWRCVRCHASKVTNVERRAFPR